MTRMVSSTESQKETVMIIEFGKVSVATRAVMPNGAVMDPVPLPSGKFYTVGRIL
jgi:hypothetical protein